MHIRHLLFALAAATTAMAAINEPCYGSNGVAGVCVSTTACASAGGTSITGACPRDPADIRCCSKPRCSNGSNGNCRWVSDCAGSTVTNQCPGPSGMRCCSSSALGWGGYSNPPLPSSSSCRQVAINGAAAVTRRFPGRTREYFCIRNCTCTSSSSDHCCGRAIDFMISDSGGAATISGREMAEWVMNNRGTLNLKYVIWGQRIWNPSVDRVMPWNQWRSQEDRGSITQNHWDHMHVSFNG
ncbi:hypothetical protein SODALDRAFT_339841 [Sodiomyces alkalinus F11]|uniref:ARB-07466-like C-terminal domain-containing protein n=1 Tax=Sodiomyces alkalinus (strain CBS 110278 / VKM F-3762 / F11) TaxID=1314773 RepID=A0A3N2PVA2_SODAK|nr:hypothetical protein SODALDRAFT_339841 [Sodiomyces alkalinus F11]ROT38432.1 hypothetical protein SODALDRAFT_339841 [Sodiomyces alkalinus F11]